MSYSVLVAVDGHCLVGQYEDADAVSIVAAKVVVATEERALIVVTDLTEGEVVYVREAA